jgi:beta-phosphoglucomutase family hydrolase
MPSPKAYIFDMDGTIADSMPFHNDAWAALVKHLGLTQVIDDEFFAWSAGRTNVEIFPRLLGRVASAQEMEQLAHQKEALYRKESAASMLPIPGFEAFVQLLQARGVPMAVGTAAPPDNIVHILDRFKLRQYFAAIVGAADISKGKPDPEVFLKGAALLGVNPADCIVFEDAPLGIEAAYRAGMRCVVVTTALTKAQSSSLVNSDHIVAWIKDFHDPVLASL